MEPNASILIRQTCKYFLSVVKVWGNFHVQQVTSWPAAKPPLRQDPRGDINTPAMICLLYSQWHKSEVFFSFFPFFAHSYVSLIRDSRTQMLPVFTLRWGQQPDWKRYPNWCLLNCCVLTLVPTVAPDMIPLNTDKWLSDQEDPEAERGGLVDQSVKMLKNFIGKVKPSCASLIIKTVISLYDHRLNSEIILMIKVLNRFKVLSH